MKKILFLGECMVELVHLDNELIKRSFAGDVYNAAVYLKRVYPEFDAEMVTAVGTDPFSVEMCRRFKAEDIGREYVFQCKTKTPGLYSIQTDAHGERNFNYWRNSSAARQLMRFIDDSVIDSMSNADMLFFSGISIAVMEPVHRASFWRLLLKLKMNGVEIVFDPNFREALWQDLEEARDQFELAFTIATMALPGVDDFKRLYQLDTTEQVASFCDDFQLKEYVVKNGADNVIVGCAGERKVYPVAPVENIVDTTSAGDAFNGVYLGARLQGKSSQESVEIASKAAAFVIQHPGAIVDAEVFKKFTKTLLT